MIPNITTELYKVTIAGDEYISILNGGTNTISNLFSGQGVGGIGTTCIMMFLVIFVVLSYMKIIEIKTPILAVLSYLVVGILFNGLDATAINICSGSFIFVSLFIMTEPNTSPNTFIGEVTYAVLFGALSALAWDMGFFGENCVFVVALICNMLVPFMDRYFIIKPATLGGYRYAHKN